MLSTYLLREAVQYGLADRLFEDWEATPIWCPDCGKRRLFGKRMAGGRLWLICRPCVIPVNLHATVALPPGVRGYVAAYRRSLADHQRNAGGGTAGLVGRCCHCGNAVPFRPTTESSPGLPVQHHLRAWCERCRDGMATFSVNWQLLATPEGQQFREEHPRFRFLPQREVEAGGGPAIVAGLECMTDTTRLTGVFARATFRPVLIDGQPRFGGDHG